MSWTPYRQQLTSRIQILSEQQGGTSAEAVAFRPPDVLRDAGTT
jgi:hypothetical protein